MRVNRMCVLLKSTTLSISVAFVREGIKLINEVKPVYCTHA